MAEINIIGNKLLRTIRKEFQETFPYLGLSFFNAEEWKAKSAKGEAVTPLYDGITLASARSIPASKDEKPISIHGRTLVKTLESHFLNTYGLCVQVTFQKGSQIYYTADDMDDMSLTQLNKKLEEEGFVKNPGNGMAGVLGKEPEEQQPKKGFWAKLFG